MKDFIFPTAKWFMLALLFSATIAITGCSNDEDDTTPTPTLVEDGFYVNGDATFLGDFDLATTFSSTLNEVGQKDRPELLEAVVALNAGSFNIVQVAGSDRTTWGPAADFAEVATGTTDEPKVPFWRGSLEVTDNAFTITDQGLYHIYIDTEVAKVVIVPVSYWGIIGGATPNGWGDDTRMESTGFDAGSITFQATDVALTLGDFKFRMSGGWKVEVDTTYDDGSGDIGIKANTNFGGSVDALAAGGDNITNSEGGIYTVTMVWTAGEGYTASLEKTDDLPAEDWTNIELGLVGDGLMNMGAQHNWDETIFLTKPDANGTVYTYTFADVQVTTGGGGFKMREGQTWDNKIIGFPDIATIDGDGAADFETNGDGNFVPLVDMATYDMVFVVNGQTDDRTLTITKK
jgi:hypothetical protein